MDADAQILKWARSKWGENVAKAEFYNRPDYVEGCPTCGDYDITIDVVLTYNDGKVKCPTVDFTGDLITEILNA